MGDETGWDETPQRDAAGWEEETTPQEPEKSPREHLDDLRNDPTTGLKAWITQPIDFAHRFSGWWNIQLGLIIIVVLAGAGAFITILAASLTLKPAKLVGAVLTAGWTALLGIIGLLVLALILHLVATLLFNGSGKFGSLIGGIGFTQAYLLPYTVFGWVFTLLGALPFVGGVFKICLLPIQLLLVLAYLVHGLIFGYAVLLKVYGFDPVKTILVMVVTFVIVIVLIALAACIFAILALALGIGLGFGGLI